MYEELVRRLRTISPEEYGNPMDFAFGVQQAMCEAADAIEELSKQLEQKKKKEPYQRKRKKCCCGASRAYLYAHDGVYYLKCHGCGKRTPVMYDKNELDAVWNEIADVPVEYKETSDISAEKENEE